ncbi:NAD(P)/FAD-dependent oxidoreductase [Paenibacillus camelliae]|uniref:NAD(P)/FAD-dependent oxidoreductase n=1 Tax=Paenibacillus camelliae TaxID=512410 RepID=UPI002040F099|nr:FAD-binding oxidoreductase [Paenibacillus camelliae]MCM3634293.1 FAD-binding oxidoreductase [Paenibacillus camelliae]
MKKVIVIGGGILGASAAYQLSMLGAEVTIIDRKDTGQATDAAAGIICPWLSQRRNKRWYRLAKAGARFYPSLIEELEKAGEGNTGYAKVGAICLHHDMQKLEAIRERAEQRKADAPEIGELTMLTEAEANKLFPLLSEGYYALHVSGAARVDGRELRDALLRAAKRNGVCYIEGDAELQQEQSEITGVRVGSETYTADEVIVCAGAWSNALLHPLGIMMQVTYQKAQIMHLQHEEGRANTTQWPVVMPPTDQYLLAFADGRLVIGATHENDVVGYDTSVTAGGMHEVLSKGLQTAAGLATASLKEIRVGFRPFTADFLPVLGRVACWNKLIVANGLGASGLTMGPYLGQQLAKLAMEQQVDIPLEDYAVELAT